MDSSLWELRFLDGRGASFFTTADVTMDIGKRETTRTMPVASRVRADLSIGDARRAFREGRVVTLVANMQAIAYAVRHDPT